MCMTRNELGAPSLVMDDLKGKAKIRENMRITIAELQNLM
jgi:hypothetical protein